MIGKVERGLVHVEDPTKITMRTNEEQTDLLEEGRHLLAHLGNRASRLVGHLAINIIMFLHKATNGLQLGL